MVETNQAADISYSSATLNGNIIDNGGKVDEYGFIYWDASLNSETKVILESSYHTGSFSKTIKNLAPGTYNYKAYAKNTKGTDEGQVYSFTIVKQPIKIVIDSKVLILEVPPFIEQDQTMVPFRAIFEELGASVQWDSEARTIIAVRDVLIIKLVIGGAAYKNGEIVNLDVPVKIVNNRAMVPLRFVSEALGYIVTWDDVNKTVMINR